MNRIEKYLRLIPDAGLREAVETYLKHHWEKLSVAPASIKFHHTYTGGLLDHIVEMLDVGLHIISFQNLKDRVNIEYFIVSVLIHDMAKVDRYEWDEETQEWGYSNLATGTDPHIIIVGRADHSVYPLLDFPEITGMNLPREVALAVLGHMGGYSVTSVKPDTLLEVVVSASDYISSRLVRSGENE